MNRCIATKVLIRKMIRRMSDIIFQVTNILLNLTETRWERRTSPSRHRFRLPKRHHSQPPETVQMERPPALAGRSFIVWPALVAFMDDSKLHRDWFGPCPFSRSPPGSRPPCWYRQLSAFSVDDYPNRRKEPREKKPEGKGHDSVQPCRPKAPPRKLW